VLRFLLDLAWASSSKGEHTALGKVRADSVNGVAGWLEEAAIVEAALGLPETSPFRFMDTREPQRPELALFRVLLHFRWNASGERGRAKVGGRYAPLGDELRGLPK
jgi:hypothetical protein